MHDSRHPGRVEDYTGAFLVTFGVILFMTFWAIAAVAGFAWVVICAILIDRLIRLGAKLKDRSAMRSTR